jgi:peptidoglycan/LPS O-acetylase OafA/YrhL
MPNKPHVSPRFLELDALRGIAVMFVVCFHLTMGHDSAKFFNLGVTGVDLFFVISGFVILLTLEKVNQWQDFVVSRFSRLYPTYCFCVTLTAGMMVVKSIVSGGRLGGVSIGQYLANMTMFQLYLGVPDIDGSYWTMIVEMIFYIFMFSVFLLKKLPKIERIGLFMLVPVILYHLTLNTQYHIVHQALGRYLPLINHFPLFFAGILVYKIKFDRSTFLRHLGIVVCFMIQYQLFFDGGKSRFFIEQPAYGAMLLFYLLLVFLYTNNQLSFIVNRASLFMGNISYSLYLLHQFLALEVIMPVAMKYAHVNFWVAGLGIALPITIVVATLINQYVEKPMTRRIRSWYKDHSKTTAQPRIVSADRD